jgi:hypothetical protein
LSASQVVSLTRQRRTVDSIADNPDDDAIGQLRPTLGQYAQHLDSYAQHLDSYAQHLDSCGQHLDSYAKHLDRDANIWTDAPGFPPLAIVSGHRLTPRGRADYLDIALHLGFLSANRVMERDPGS